MHLRPLVTLGLALAALAARAGERVELVVASFPSFDESVKLAIPRFERLHPGIQVKLRSLSFGDHHNAMFTALASRNSLPDVMAIEFGFVERFAESGGLEDLSKPSYDAKPLLAKLTPFTELEQVLEKDKDIKQALFDARGGISVLHRR
jgi:multiple sugar transport system substrate-binding protein